MRCFLIVLLAIFPVFCKGRIVVKDDAGNTVILERPARRIVGLAPNITELLYAAGAGKSLVGAVEYSDYPKEALKLERVGGAQALDIERIAALHPDLVVAWKSGNPSGQIEKLQSLGFAVFFSEPKRLEDIPENIGKLGLLSGTEDAARQAAGEFRSRLEALKRRYAGKSPVPVFYEVWPNPLMTVNGEHIISDVMRLCGARNVFGKLPVLVPTVSVESVLEANPEAIVASGDGDRRPAWLDDWRKWKIAASGNLFFIPADFVSRQSPRILLGAEMLCSRIDDVRNKRNAAH